jgi:hypothetical protein
MARSQLGRRPGLILLLSLSSFLLAQEGEPGKVERPKTPEEAKIDAQFARIEDEARRRGENGPSLSEIYAWRALKAIEDLRLSAFDESASHAKSALTPAQVTTDPSRTVVYVEKSAKGFYYQSNYSKRGYTARAGGRDLNDVGAAFMNMVLDNPPFLSEHTRVAEIFRNDVEVLLDTSVFSSDGYPLVDLRGARNIRIVNGRDGKVLTNGSIERLDRSSPPPLLLSKVQGCCIYGIPPHLAPGFHQALQQRRFQKRDVRFLSLIRDSGTEKAIGKAFNLASLSLGRIGQRIESLSQIERAFKSAQGKTVVMLSHVEGEEFVVRNPRQEIVLSVQVATVRALAKQYQVELVDLGLLSRICGAILVPGVVPSCDKGQFP